MLAGSRSLQPDDKPVNVAIEELNPYLLCSLCFGYLYEATTITECMHTFCKPCIVRHLESTDTCPTCDMLIHPTDPFSALLSDNTVQEIVNKLLPRVAEVEFARRREFYRKHPNTNAHDDTEASTQNTTVTKDIPADASHETPYENVSIFLEHLKYESTFPVHDLAMKFVRVNGQATMAHVEKFLRRKLHLPRFTQLLFYCDNIVLENSFTLHFIHCNLFESENVIMCLSYSVHGSDFLIDT